MLALHKLCFQQKGQTSVLFYLQVLSVFFAVLSSVISNPIIITSINVKNK